MKTKKVIKEIPEGIKGLTIELLKSLIVVSIEEIEDLSSLANLCIEELEIRTKCYKNKVFSKQKLEPKKQSKKAVKKQVKKTAPKGCKICSACGKTLPVSMFYNNKKAKDGLETKCKKCRNKK
jgi:hypothetical protein